jgi:hypothetical protein
LNITLPELSGTPVDGMTLSANPGLWIGMPEPTFRFQWLRCNADGEQCVEIRLATSEAYTLSPADVGTTLRARVTASNGAAESTAVSAETAVVAPAPPANTVLPAVTGTPREGQVLSASKGEWTGTPPLDLATQWERCNAGGTRCAAIPRATSTSYVPTSADVGMALRVAITASNAAAVSVIARSLVSGVVAAAPLINLEPPAIVGLAQVGHSLRATTGEWAPSGPADFVYRWLRCSADGSDCTPIPGATGSRYEVRTLDVGSRLRVRVTAINDAGSSARDSALTAVVTAPFVGSSPAPPTLMRPFPRVRIRGYFTDSGAVLQRVSVRGPRGARIALSCSGRDCPFRQHARRLPRRVRVRSLERSFRAGTQIVVRVTKSRRIGKHTRIVIRAGRPPTRRDRCLMPGSSRPMQCPGGPA